MGNSRFHVFLHPPPLLIDDREKCHAVEETCRRLRVKVRATEEVRRADAGGVDYLKTGGAA